MTKKFPIKPANPERICWGCDRYCPSHSLQCGNGTVATPHPSELFGDDWMEWGLDATNTAVAAAQLEVPSEPVATSSSSK
jgi:hypothetical protein